VIRLLPRLCLTATLLVGAAAPASSGEPPADLPIASSDLPGSYNTGYDLAVRSLALREDGRFEHRIRGCLGEVSEFGRWELTGGEIHLHHEGTTLFGLTTPLVPVGWGSVMYLVEQRRMSEFCFRAADASETEREQLGVFLRSPRRGPLGATGEPLLPICYRSLYRNAPVSAHVARYAVGGAVILDKGSRQRVKAGLTLSLDGVTGAPRTELRVVSVTENESVARAVYPVTGSRPKVGDRFASWIPTQRRGSTDGLLKVLESLR
jgi:hypothetical protein